MLHAFIPQALANTAWAFATAGIEAPKLFDALDAEAAKKLGAFSNQNVQNFTKAFSLANRPAPRFQEAKTKLEGR
ncbi:hypothetical protein M885DRAFT_519253 [Pelagophyceae sp. CCMP2097]|nr:hypothetical protein M885DRAFT_519253 [Pelagophyceae sp. CCMP2097]